MSLKPAMTSAPPEYNVTGQDYADRRHFCYTGPPLIDIHAHVMLTRPGESPTSSPSRDGAGASMEQAALLLEAAYDFGINRTCTMCPPEDIPPLRARFGEFLCYNGPIAKKTADEPDDAAYRLLDRFLDLGVKIIKFWAAPRGRERGLYVDAPWRIEVVRRAIAAGIRVFMVHVADPDVWFRTTYADASRFGTKPEQYHGLERLLQLYPNVAWIGAHMGGDIEHPDHLEALFERYPHCHVDTSATKWVLREIAPQRDAVRSLICRYPQRFLFGVDLVTRHRLMREHYVSRYWCQRTLWESAWEGRSPITDPDYSPPPGEPSTPWLQGLSLPADVLDQVYHANACRLLGR